jgi:hypothetical protein
MADKPAGEPVWPGTWASHRHGAEMIRIDLTAADVEYEDDRGRVVDFHALRHTFITNLARAGVHPRNAQALARHSTIDLTMNVYTHVDMADLASDVESLPGMGDGPAVKAEPERLTNLPADLTHVAMNWASLPEHIRQTIETLCSG